MLGDTFESILGLRQNEYYYLDFTLDTMSIMSAYNSNNEFVTSEMFKVEIFSDNPLQEDFTYDQIRYYTVDSNGDSIINVGVSYINPESIVDLSYEELKSFYQKHYHPSNAIFMTYGDIPASEHHEALQNI